MRVCLICENSGCNHKNRQLCQLQSPTRTCENKKHAWRRNVYITSFSMGFRLHVLYTRNPPTLTSSKPRFNNWSWSMWRPTP